MLHLMRQTLADTAAASQDDRPAAGGDVDMVVQGAAAPDPEVPTGVSLSKAQNESLAKMAGERKRQLLQMSHAHLRPCRSPGCNHHRRTARDAPASKRLAPWVPHHIWKRARLTRTARGAPGSRTARGPAHGVPRRPGTRPDCVQYQSDLRGACGPQDGGKLTKNIDPAPQMRNVFFRDQFGVSLTPHACKFFQRFSFWNQKA